MGYLFADGFDNYQTLSQIWDGIQGTQTMSSLYARFPASGSTTSQGVRFSQNAYGRKNLPSNYQTLVIGFAYNFPALPTNATGIVTLDDSNTSQCYLALTPTGGFQFYRGTPNSGVAVGAASAGGLVSPNTWHFIEVEVSVSGGTGGSVKMWLDQAQGATPIINSTGLNTQSTSNSSANQVRIGDFNVFLPFFDDFYVLDTSGGSPLNGQLGDQRIITKVPSASGASTQWTPNGAATNWQCVDEIPPDDDTTYVSSNTPGQTDYYVMQNGSLSGTPNFVVTRRRHRKDDANAHTDQSTLRNSVPNTESSTAVTVPSTYVFQDDFFATDPSSAAWTAANADAVQVGVIETS
jgi:hypothetical protein